MRPPAVPTTIPLNEDDNKQTLTMKTLYNTLIEHREPKTRRICIQLFMCLPSRKDFPAYYNIIEKPIAMNKIRERIESQQYVDENACFEDFKLMFSNCKSFNEDDSQIYQDAVTLEKLLKQKRDQLLSAHYKANNITDSDTSTQHNNKDPSVASAVVKNNVAASNNSTSTNNVGSNNTTNCKDSPAHLNKTSSTATSMYNNSNTNNININNSNSNNSTNIANNINNNSNNSHPSTPTHSSTKDSKSNNTNNDNNHHIDHNHSTTNELTRTGSKSSHETPQQAGNNNLKVTHDFHNETSMDSSSNLSADLLASTPIEKCSLNTRRGRNSNAPKRQLLTGYIIYASEIRKKVIDKNPDQNFGDISRLVGNEWKALPHDIRFKYDQRALIHNKRVRERGRLELNNSALSNGSNTPKLTKRKLAEMAKEQMKQHHLANHDSPKVDQEHQHNLPKPQAALAVPTSSSTSSSSATKSTQTSIIRFVEPSPRKRLAYSETFKKYIESLQVPNRPEQETPATTVAGPSADEPTSWLGAGVGRHESPEAALWALRDFMLQDAVTMARSIEPYK